MRPVVAIFAHPDDEAFFTGGTLATLAKERDVYTICVTDGDAGLNSSDKTGSMADIRKEELLASGKALGIKQTFFLNYKDGTLSNNLYHEVADKIQKILEDIQPEIVITFENRGISGHLDHIAVSMITSFVFGRVAQIKELWYYANVKGPHSRRKDYFVFWPPAYDKAEISRTIDISSVLDQKIDAIKKHVSQMHDITKLLEELPDQPKEENFIVVTKDTE